MVQGQVFLKGGDGGGDYTFPISFFQGLPFLHLEIMLCIWRKAIFFCHHNFIQIGHSKLSKNEPENIS